MRWGLSLHLHQKQKPIKILERGDLQEAMATEREKEREAELESAMYTNCLLLGLDPAIIGGGGSPRVGHFRHSNPRLGEQLLYFLLSALRGPAQSAKATKSPSPSSRWFLIMDKSALVGLC